jgi:hypothetical protein
VDRERPDSNRFWLNADRAAEDERAVREFLRGKGRGIDGSRFRAFVRDCRRRVGPGPVFEPDINMVLDGVLYDWGVWFRPRPDTENTENVAEATVSEQPLGMALPDRPPVDTVTTRDTGADGRDEAGDNSVDRESVRPTADLSAIQTVVGPSVRPAGAPSPATGSPASPSPTASPTERTSESTRPA